MRATKPAVERQMRERERKGGGEGEAVLIISLVFMNKHEFWI